ncbi:MAG: hypothetical protein H7Z43_11895 [Clostridia bacterium]|nr:hypothetical protein [Deltaproteobacteria bacterium]
MRNILERAAVLEPDGELGLDWLDTASTRVDVTGFIVSKPVSLDELERHYARWVLGMLGNKRLETAKALGISHPTLGKLLKDED